MSAKIPMTVEELLNNYQYRLTVKILKREFPWISNVLPPPQDKLNEYNLIFVTVVIDPEHLQQETQWPFMYYFGQKLLIKPSERRKDNLTPYLATMFDITYKEGRELEEQVNKVIEEVAKSPALPQDLRLPKGRDIEVSSYDIEDNFQLLNPEHIIINNRRGG